MIEREPLNVVIGNNAISTQVWLCFNDAIIRLKDISYIVRLDNGDINVGLRNGDVISTEEDFDFIIKSFRAGI
ncbi:MAG: hypothetical protein BWY74_02811 [Firmicutes bacterium ADurb.Bin419]|nr:MAG: hypothetical protein BWY74_02811 [Firmicutes bacterium ADurb.Bin419]